MNTGNFYSNGKLLLTGEYAILHGVEALALPTRYGQSLEVAENDIPVIHWLSEDSKGVWFEAEISTSDLSILQTNDEKIAQRLVEILLSALACKGDDKDFSGRGFKVKTKADFNRHWGLGTSSTLIVNGAKWFDISPWELYWKTFQGSGYDIACAMADSPVLYKLDNKSPVVTPVNFSPTFKDSIFFVYTGKKMDTQKSLAEFSRYYTVNDKLNAEISQITKEILNSEDLEVFMELLNRHEELISGLLGSPPIQQAGFPDFQGQLKSLGAWGGDFFLATSVDPVYLVQYFSARGYETIVDYETMVL